MAAHAVCGLRRGMAEPDGEIERERHARRHGLTVEQLRAEAGLRLERVSEGMAEIQQLTLAALALIRRDHGGLLGTALSHRADQRGRIPREQLRAVALQPFEESTISDQTVLHHF